MANTERNAMKSLLSRMIVLGFVSLVSTNAVRAGTAGSANPGTDRNRKTGEQSTVPPEAISDRTDSGKRSDDSARLYRYLHPDENQRQEKDSIYKRR
jgi:hypothetical protein